MIKTTLSLIAFVLVFIACKQDPKPTQSTSETTAPSELMTPVPEKGTSGTDRLKAEALENSDFFTLVNRGFEPTRTALNASSTAIPALQGATLTVDAECAVVFQDRNARYEFNLKDMNIKNGGIRLIKEEDSGDFPGYAIATIGNKPLIKKTQNGQTTMVNEWGLSLMDRTAIDQSVPGIVQSVMICRDEIPD